MAINELPRPPGGGKLTFISDLMSGSGRSRDELLLMLLAGLFGSGCGNAEPAPVSPPPPAPSASKSSAGTVPRNEPVEEEASPPSALRFAAREAESGIEFTYRN